MHKIPCYLVVNHGFTESQHRKKKPERINVKACQIFGGNLVHNNSPRIFQLIRCAQRYHLIT